MKVAKVVLNIEVSINENDYNDLMANLKDVCGLTNKCDLENYISDGLVYDIEKNNSKFLFD